MKNNYHEKLEACKQNEQPEAVLIIANNHFLIKMLVAWPNVSVGPKNVQPDNSSEGQA